MTNFEKEEVVTVKMRCLGKGVGFYNQIEFESSSSRNFYILLDDIFMFPFHTFVFHFLCPNVTPLSFALFLHGYLFPIH